MMFRLSTAMFQLLNKCGRWCFETQVTLSILPKDVDNLRIAKAKGRFIEVAWQRQGSDENPTKDAVFQSKTGNLRCPFLRAITV